MNESKQRKTAAPRKWTKAESDLLRELWRYEPIGNISEVMQRTTSSIYQRVNLLGLKRDPSYLHISESGRFKAGQKPNRSSFSKGSSPWNKGKKGWQAGGRSKETQFKLGDRPSNTWRPVGAERTCKDGHLWRKVSDTGNKTQDWKPVRVIVWEEKNGPVPFGHIIVLKDKDKSNLEPSNLMALTRAENMRRNSIDRYPGEYRKTAITLGWFKRKINKLEKEHANNQ